ncbi:hypothetical protein Tco_0540037, partial [Tanacetum coccineum]
SLGITPKDPAHPFVAPPAGDLVIDFVNNLGYPEELQFVSKMYGVVTGTNVDYVELIWEEFVQAIKTFFFNAASLKVPSKKPKPHVIPYCQFTKLIICYLGGRHNIHKRPQSPLYITADDYTLDNLKFVPKGEMDEKNTVPPADKSKKPALAKQMNHVKEKSTKPTPSKKANKVDDDEYNLQRGIQMSLESFQPPVGEVAICEPTSCVTRSLLVVEGKGKGIATDEQATLSLLDLQKPKEKSIADQYIIQRRIPVNQDATTGPSKQPQDDTSANVVRDTLSPRDAKTGADTKNSNSEGDTEILNVNEERGENVSNTVALKERTVKLDKGQTGSDPGNTLEYRPLQDED